MITALTITALIEVCLYAGYRARIARINPPHAGKTRKHHSFR